MAVRQILQIGDPVLRQRAREVTADFLVSAEFSALVTDLFDTMEAASGAGLAAPQIGESWRVAVLRVSANPRYPELGEIPQTLFVNPVLRVVPSPRVVHFYEGCLSVPALRGRVTRPAHIEVEALDHAGTPFQREFRDAAASVVQHELDHLDGVLFVDRADPRTFCALSEFSRTVPTEQRIVVSEDGAASARDV